MDRKPLGCRVHFRARITSTKSRWWLSKHLGFIPWDNESGRSRTTCSCGTFCHVCMFLGSISDARTCVENAVHCLFSSHVFLLTSSLLFAIRCQTMIISELHRIIGWFWVTQAKKCILCTMYVRKKHNRSGSTSVVVVSKASEKYREI